MGYYKMSFETLNNLVEKLTFEFHNHRSQVTDDIRAENTKN